MTQKYYNPLSDMNGMKTSLMSLFCDSDDLTKLIMPQLDDNKFTFAENWYGGKFAYDTDGETKIIDLPGHCFDTPYIEGAVTDKGCAVFVETYLTKIENQHIKEVGVDIMVVCHMDSVKLSDEDKKYYESIGVYGNRVDSAIQIINASILNPEVMDKIKQNYSIGAMNLLDKTPLEQYVPGTKFYGKVLHYTYQAFYHRKNNIRQVIF